jgi:hypothetical protein
MVLCRAMRQRLTELEGDTLEKQSIADEATTASAEPATVAENVKPVDGALTTEQGAKRAATTAQVRTEQVPDGSRHRLMLMWPVAIHARAAASVAVAMF